MFSQVQITAVVLYVGTTFCTPTNTLSIGILMRNNDYDAIVGVFCSVFFELWC